MISVISVPHTGTKFTEKLLMDMGYDVRCCHVHSTHPLQTPQTWINEGGLIVIPWRDRELVRISAENRGETPRPDEEFLKCLEWGTLPHVHIFEVEPGSDEAKDGELALLRAFLGTEAEVITDWAPVNESEDVTGLKAAWMVRDPMDRDPTLDIRPVVPIESLAP